MKKNILVVDDSALMRRVICDIINTDSNFQATDVCRDGQEAYEKLKTTSYDGVVLDINMPKMDGLQLLEQLQKDRIKANIIMVSTVTKAGASETIEALEKGAIDFVAKPSNIIEAKGEDFKTALLKVLNNALAVKSTISRERLQALSRNTRPTVDRTVDSKLSARTSSSASSTGTSTASERIAARRAKGDSGTTNAIGAKAPSNRLRTSNSKNKLVALACSTGGPKALQDVIPYLSKNLNAPMVLVQHMPAGFTKSMADRLDEISQITVTEAVDNEKLEKGHVYVAPGGLHMEVKKNTDGSHCISLNDAPAIGGLKPCANITYESLITSGFDEIVCVVLTGMGADGTNGILSLCQKKPVYVISQDAKTCVVYGMPKMIAETGVVDEIVPLKEVAQTINKYVGVK